MWESKWERKGGKEWERPGGAGESESERESDSAITDKPDKVEERVGRERGEREERENARARERERGRLLGERERVHEWRGSPRLGRGEGTGDRGGREIEYIYM